MKTIAALILCPLACFAGPLETYVANRPTMGVHAILAELRGVETTLATNPVVRVTRQDELKLKNLVVTNLLTAAEWNQVATREGKIDNALDSKMGKAGITDAEFIALAKIEARVRILRKRIERNGGDAIGESSGTPTAQAVTETKGYPLWKRLGLPAEPEPEEIRRARGDK